MVPSQRAPLTGSDKIACPSSAARTYPTAVTGSTKLKSATLKDRHAREDRKNQHRDAGCREGIDHRRQIGQRMSGKRLGKSLGSERQREIAESAQRNEEREQKIGAKSSHGASAPA